MTLKTYKTVQMIVAVLLGITFSQAIIFNNLVVPVIAAIVGVLVMLLLRRRVRDIIADERDWAMGGKAALLSLQIYSWFAVVGMLILYAKRDVNPAYEAIAATLAFSTCFLMLLYSLIFKYHDKIKFAKNKKVYVALGAVIFILVLAFGIRLLSGEDAWICKDGAWVKHGQPAFPAPQAECK